MVASWSCTALIFVTAAIAAFVLYRTRYGRHVIAVGSSEDVARYSGISVKRVRTIAYIVQGLCVAVAVLLYVPRLGSTSATTGMLWELQAIDHEDCPDKCCRRQQSAMTHTDQHAGRMGNDQTDEANGTDNRHHHRRHHGADTNQNGIDAPHRNSKRRSGFRTEGESI